jgi:hypothetical protein
MIIASPIHASGPVRAYTGTWANRPDASQYPANAAAPIFVTDVGENGTFFYSNGIDWVPAAEGSGITQVPIRAKSQVVHAAPPTITYTATEPTGKRQAWPLPTVVQRIGCDQFTVNTSFNSITHGVGGVAGFEAELTGDEIHYGWRCGVSTGERVMVWVDGQPCMAAPATPSVTTSAGTFYWISLAFASVARRKIEIQITNTNGSVGVYLPLTASICPTPRKPTVLLVGDSFLGTNAGSTDSANLVSMSLARMYDCNVVTSSMAGTGYVAVGSFVKFGDATRVSIATYTQPDKIIFLGSVNDDAQAGIQAAAELCYEAYRTAAPTAEMIVFGPQPTNATDTIGANRTANAAAVKAAAVAKGLTFYDIAGVADGVPAAFSTGTSYQPDGKCTRYGSVWKHSSTIATTYSNAAAGPGQNRRWELLTLDVFGTGKVGSTASDGTRDTYLGSDGIHPTAVWQGALAQRLGQALLS